jgi:hypothetical protein
MPQAVRQRCDLALNATFLNWHHTPSLPDEQKIVDFLVLFLTNVFAEAILREPGLAEAHR